MNWNSKVDERTKQKIELLYREFDKFIEQNHAASSSEDGVVLKEWSSFKQLIEKNPTDFESMHQYLSKLGDEERNQLKITKQNTTSTRKLSGVTSAIDINKNKLKKISGDVLGAIGKNNKELFRV